jgi:hypothetical protein
MPDRPHRPEPDEFGFDAFDLALDLEKIHRDLHQIVVWLKVASTFLGLILLIMTARWITGH